MKKQILHSQFILNQFKMTNKKAKLEEKLTALPDSILCHILSFLPTHEAIQTVLIQRLGTLWTSLPVHSLLAHQWPIYKEDTNTNFFHLVHNVLKLHQRPTLDTFKVDIGTVIYADIECKSLRQDLDTWLSFALRKQVKVLEFGFRVVDPYNELYKLPFTEFVSDSLFKLKLVNIEVELQKKVQMVSLRVLTLLCLRLNDDVFREVIRGCPLLKDLEICNCWNLTELSAPSLDILKLDRALICWDVNLRIDCPELSSFDYTGCVNGLEIINLSSLDNFTFYITEQELNQSNQFQYVLSKLLHAKTVSMSSEFVEALCCMLKHLPHVIVNWKHVELNSWLTEKHVCGICHLLSNAPYLEELVLKFTFGYAEFLEVKYKLLESDSASDQQQYCWSSLRTIVICNISATSYTVLVRLVKILLKSSLALDRLGIYYEDNDDKISKSEQPQCLMNSEELADFSKKLPSFTKAPQFPTATVLLL